MTCLRDIKGLVAMGVGFMGVMKFFLKCRILEVLGDDECE